MGKFCVPKRSYEHGHRRCNPTRAVALIVVEDSVPFRNEDSNSPLLLAMTSTRDHFIFSSPGTIVFQSSLLSRPITICTVVTIFKGGLTQVKDRLNERSYIGLTTAYFLILF